MSDRPWPNDKIARISILCSIMCLTLVGNVYILIELLCRRHQHRTRLHIFIVNLAIGDLTIFFCTMTSELFVLIFDHQWILGNFACKLTFYLQVVTLASTTFINVVMTYDRYETICCPFQKNKSHSRIRFFIASCWFSSFIVATPQWFIFQVTLVPGNTKKYRCASTGYTAEWQRQLYFTIFASYVLFIPVLCMSFWYIRIISVVGTSIKIWTQTLNERSSQLSSTKITSPTKIKTIKLALMIIIVFVACWTPYMIATLIEIYSHGRIRLPSWLDGILQAFCLLQSGLNPIIYMSFNKERRYAPALTIAAASTICRKHDPVHRQHRRERGGSISFFTVDDDIHRGRGTSCAQF